MNLIVDKVASDQGDGHIECFNGKSGAGEKTDVTQILFPPNNLDHRVQTIFQIFRFGPFVDPRDFSNRFCGFVAMTSVGN